MNISEITNSSKEMDKEMHELEQESPFVFNDNYEFLVQILRKLGGDVGCIPLICKRWYQIIFGPFYDALYREKKPFGDEEWVQHFKIKPVGVPRIPIPKLIEFNPALGQLTLIVTRYKDGETVKRLSLSQLFSQIKHESQVKPDCPYKFTADSAMTFFQAKSPFTVFRQNPSTENFWFYSDSKKHALPFNAMNQLLRLPHNHKLEMEAYLPGIFPTILTFITHHARTGNYFFENNPNSPIHIVVKESADFRVLRLGVVRLFGESKLCVSFTEQGISVRKVDTFRDNVRNLTIIPFEYYCINPE